MGWYLLQMFGVSLGLTLLLEGIVVFLWGLRGKKELLLAVLVNIVTNPAAVLSYWLYRIYFLRTSIIVQIVIELVVVVAEAGIYKSFAKETDWQIKRPVLLAVVANGFSWGTGVLLSLI